MLLGALYLVSALVSTAFVFRVYLPRVSSSVCWIASVPAGFTAAAWLSAFSHSVLGGAGPVASILVPTLIMTAVALCAHAALRSKGLKIPNPHDDWRAWWPMWAVVFVSALWFVPITRHHNLSTGEADGALYVGGSCYGDLAIHLIFITSFAWGPNSIRPLLQWKSPIVFGEPLRYPFICDYFSSVLLVSGFPLPTSIWIPSSFLILSFNGLLYILSCRFSRSHWAGATAVALVNNAGGWGFLRFFPDLARHLDRAWDGGIISFFVVVGEFLRTMPLDYVYNVYEGGHTPYWFQFAGNVTLPQRTSLQAFPLVVLVFFLLYEGLQSHSPLRRPYFVAAGILSGLLPFTTAHAYVAVFFFCAVAVPFHLNAFVDWICMAIPAAVLGAPQILHFASGAAAWGFATYAPLWRSQPPQFPSFVVRFLPDWISFWPANLGLTAIFGVLGITLLLPHQRRFYAGFLAILVVGTLLQFQPWHYDNIKLLYMWLFGGACVAACVLERIRKGFVCPLFSLKPLKRNETQSITVGHVLFTTLLVVMCFSGFLGNVRETYLHHQYFSREDRATAEWIRDHTDPDAVILVSRFHAHPVPALSGRHQIIAYAGWTSSHGYLNTRVVEREYGMMWGGRDPDCIPIFEAYNVSHVVTGPRWHNPVSNTRFFDGALELAHTSCYEEYAIYRVPKPKEYRIHFHPPPPKPPSPQPVPNQPDLTHYRGLCRT